MDRAEKDHARREHHRQHAGEVAIGHQPNINDWLGSRHFPNDQEGNCDGSGYRSRRYETAAKPVVALAAVKEQFETAEADGYEQKADEVDFKPLGQPRLAFVDQLPWLIDEDADEKDRQHTDGHIN